LGKVTEVVLKGMARSLNLEDDCFLEQYGKRSTMTARFNYYPKCPRPDLVLGVKPHADGSGITILLQDKEVEGLQFQKDNQWFKVPIISEALLINVGDQAEVTIMLSCVIFIMFQSGLNSAHILEILLS
jgi:isopenicillin N synthase-like dioxygenase